MPPETPRGRSPHTIRRSSLASLPAGVFVWSPKNRITEAVAPSSEGGLHAEINPLCWQAQEALGVLAFQREETNGRVQGVR